MQVRDVLSLEEYMNHVSDCEYVLLMFHTYTAPLKPDYVDELCACLKKLEHDVKMIRINADHAYGLARVFEVHTVPVMYFLVNQSLELKFEKAVSANEVAQSILSWKSLHNGYRAD